LLIEQSTSEPCGGRDFAKALQKHSNFYIGGHCLGLLHRMTAEATLQFEFISASLDVTARLEPCGLPPACPALALTRAALRSHLQRSGIVAPHCGILVNLRKGVSG
jgi:hypothetical protein